MEYITVSQYGVDDFIEKKSRFIGYCKNVSTAKEAEDFIKEIKTKHKDANHNVWAYNLREGSNMRYSDDGEPQGSAGMPVLQVLKNKEIVDAVVVATRYFGGIELGKGGLVRAYTHTASIATNSAEPVCMKECIRAEIVISYSYLTKIGEYLQSNNAVVLDTIYEDNIKITFYALKVDIDKIQPLIDDLTKGKVSIKEISKEFHGFSLKK